MTSHTLSFFVNTFGHDEIMSFNTKETPAGASTKAPHDGGTYRFRGSSQGTEHNHEALIRRLKQEEKEINAFIMSVRARFSAVSV